MVRSGLVFGQGILCRSRLRYWSSSWHFIHFPQYSSLPHLGNVLRFLNATASMRKLLLDIMSPLLADCHNIQ